MSNIADRYRCPECYSDNLESTSGGLGEPCLECLDCGHTRSDGHFDIERYEHPLWGGAPDADGGLDSEDDIREMTVGELVAIASAQLRETSECDLDDGYLSLHFKADDGEYVEWSTEL